MAEAIADVRAELVPELKTVNVAVTNIDNTLSGLVGLITSIPNNVIKGITTLNPLGWLR